MFVNNVHTKLHANMLTKFSVTSPSSPSAIAADIATMVSAAAGEAERWKKGPVKAV